MSGPPYPRYASGAAPGGGAIGSFIIGASPIGDVAPFDVWQTIISEYANSSTISQLCTNMGQYVDPTRDLDAFFDTIWNIDTAIGYGLDVWGRILGISRTVQLPAGVQPYLGFEEPGTPTVLTPFGQAPFFSGESLVNNFSIGDPLYRVMLLTKALANICDGSIPAVNQILLNLFHGSGNSYVSDGLNMTETYTFTFPLSALQLAIVTNSGIIPRTSGVAALILQDVPP